MIGSIIEIVDNRVLIKLAIDINKQPNLIGLHVVFEDTQKHIVGEIVNVSQTEMTAVVVGELTPTSFIPGASMRSSFKSNLRLVNFNELGFILGC